MNAGENERLDSPLQSVDTDVMVEDAVDNARPRSPRRRKAKRPSALGKIKDRHATSEGSLRTIKQAFSSTDQCLLRQVYSFPSTSQRHLRTGGGRRRLSLPSIPDFDRWASSSDMDVDVVASTGRLEESLQTYDMASPEEFPVKTNASCPVRRHSDSNETLVSIARAAEQSDHLEIFLDGL
jgi:hypothetical protein